MAAKVYKPEYPGLYYFDTFTFTTLGTSGHRGPDPTKGYANAPWRDGDFSIVDGQQLWTVPATGTYHVVAAGAYGATPGRTVSGDVDLYEGQTLTMLVGQQPTPLTSNAQDNLTVGGGGGTFVVSDGVPLIVASGGDGTGGHAASFDLKFRQEGIPNFVLNATFVTTLDDTGNRLTALAINLSTFEIIGSRLFEWSVENYTWSLNHLFASETCLYVDDTIAYTTNWSILSSPYSIRINEFEYGTWNLLRYTDITSLFQISSVQMSQGGTTLLLGNFNTRNILLYKRIGTSWVFTIEITGENFGTFGTLSEDGNRFVSRSQSGTVLYVRDYPWSTRTDYSVNEYPYGCISPDGSLYTTFGNVYSLTDGSIVFPSLPGYIFQNNSAINISKDNKTITKNVTGTGLQIIKYPFTSVSSTVSGVFFFQSKLNQDATVFTNSELSDVIVFNTEASRPQPAIAQPYGAGNGINGAGYFSDGSATSTTFQFLKPSAYVNGGYGNIYVRTVVPEEGGFGGGQSPVASGFSGGGGYTGSPGSGAVGALCYADASVANFTDLGASCNTSGTVTVTLIDPVPLVETWSWDDEAPWENINTFQSNAYTVSWCESLGVFLVAGNETTPQLSISKDGKTWTQPILTGASIIYSTAKTLVSATDKPIVIWGDLTSNDGTTWKYNNMPISDQPRTVYLNNMFLTSANQPAYGGYGLYTSTDGFTWSCVSPSFYGTVNAYNNSVYVGILSTFATQGGSIMFSNNLINWTTVDTEQTFNSVAYGNGVFVAVGGGAYVSVDGITWNQSTVPDGWIPENTDIIFGNGVFIVSSHRSFSTGYINIYSTVDGINWVFESRYTDNTNNNLVITYSPSLQVFLSMKYQKTPQLSIDARYFVPSGTTFKEVPQDFAWSTELQALVVVTGAYGITSPVYMYTSFDQGKTWEEKLLFEEFLVNYNIHVVWSRELGSFFIYLATSYTSLTIFTSTDGVTWNSIIKPLNSNGFEFTKPFWCKQKGIFTNGRFSSRDGITWVQGDEYTSRSVVAYSEKLGIFISSYLYPSGTCGYSYDGSHWTNLPYFFTSVAWSPSLGLFVAVDQTTDYPTIVSLYGSTNGINWNKISEIINVGGQLGYSIFWIVWSDELQKFYSLFAFPFVSHPFRLSESSDGYTWTTTYPEINTGDYTYNFFWVSGLDRFVVQSKENFKGLTFSTKSIKQF